MSAYQVQADPTDVIAKRYVAAVVDVGLGLLVGVIGFLIALALFSHNVIRYDYDRYGNYGPQQNRELSGVGWLVFLGIGLAYMVGVFVIQRGLTTKTLGTAALGVAVVKPDGQAIGIGPALLRSVAGVVDYIGICSIPIVGIATSASSKGHRRVGDMAAKTFVVDKAYAGQPVVVPGLAGAVGMGGPYAQPYGTQAYAGQPYGQPYGAPGATPYPPQAGYGQQQPYPAQPQYGAPAPGGYPAPPAAAPGTGWPAPPVEAPVTPPPTAPTDGSGWGAPGATDAPEVETPPDVPIETPPFSAAETVEPQAGDPAPSEAPARPQAPAEPQAEAPTSPELAADPTQPQWDAARNAYIQWDPDGQRWLQYDDGAQQWLPIS